jgi:hypothetical protein
MQARNIKQEIYRGKGSASFLSGSLFTNINTKYWWVSLSTIEFQDQQFELKATYESTLYTGMGRLTGANFYRGIIIANNKEVGNLSFTVYTNDKGCVITGTWEEEGYLINEVWGEYHWQ